MTVLTAETTRRIPWSALRLGAGALLLVCGLAMLVSSYRSGSGSLVGLGVILCALGITTSVELTAESVMLPVLAILGAFVPFGLFIAFAAGKNPFSVVELMYTGAFGSWFSFQNTLTRAAPLMLTGLCTALPMRVGLVIIGGEGALVMGALVAAGVGHAMGGAPPWLMLTTMLTAGALTGGIWISIAGALKHYRGVNETISSLLLVYIGVAIMNHMVEGPWKDPASLNKPSTWSLANADGDLPLGTIPHMDVHWGLVYGIVACVVCWILMNRTTFGFAAQVVGGNVRAAKVAGLSLGKIILTTCMIAGAAAGLAGGIEVAAVQGSANATVVSGYGYAGILVAFLARQNPIGVLPVAILLGGLAASGDLLQQNMKLPDATVQVLQGMIFLMILASETFYGKLKFFEKREVALG